MEEGSKVAKEVSRQVAKMVSRQVAIKTDRW